VNSQQLPDLPLADAIEATWLRHGLLALLIAFSPSTSVRASVEVIVGPTPIVDGDAKAAGDITVTNEKLAFALAVESQVPYGVPRGALIDIAPVRKGIIGRDRIVFADFIPNNWSAWPNTYRHVKFLERGPGQVIIRVERDWGKVTISTVYTLKANADRVGIQTTMNNRGDTTLTGLLSGLTLWPKGGYLFGVPGLAGIEQGPADGALSDRVVAYDGASTVTLHAPYFDHIGFSSKDMYRLHTLAAGESRTFEGWLQVGSNGDLKPVIQAEIERKHLPSGSVHGLVKERDGKAIEAPVIVIEKQGKPYAWVLGNRGRYEFKLPQGDYDLYATGKNYSQSVKTSLNIAAGANETRDFLDLQLPGRIRFSIVDSRSGKPLDARITIADGPRSPLGFLGAKVFFTALDRKGRTEVTIGPGDYLFTASSGGGFLAANQSVKVKALSGRVASARIALTPLFDPPADGWYSADLHHHADQAEAVTPPDDLARSQLAAGLDVLFVSDHDSTVNHQALQRIADRRGMAFIPGIELSPSWGHFNAYPILPGRRLAIDTSTAPIDAIFKEARRQGAIVVQVNHAFIPYGYFTSLDAGIAPGGFNPGFDLLEINAAVPADDDKVLHKLWEFWNAGRRYYLSAGTDTHDVWNEESGRARSFAHIDGKVTAIAFAEALKAGHAYVTYGPLIFPTVMFGKELNVKPDEPFVLGFTLKSVDGVKQAQLIEGGTVLSTEIFPDSPPVTHIDFSLTTSHAAWYSLAVLDRGGRKAYTNPIWVRVASAVGSAQHPHEATAVP
jgi:hypothetical protein